MRWRSGIGKKRAAERMRYANFCAGHHMDRQSTRFRPCSASQHSPRRCHYCTIFDNLVRNASQISCSGTREPAHSCNYVQGDTGRRRVAVVLWLFTRGVAHDFDCVAYHVGGAALAFRSFGHYFCSGVFVKRVSLIRLPFSSSTQTSYPSARSAATSKEACFGVSHKTVETVPSASLAFTHQVKAYLPFASRQA